MSEYDFEIKRIKGKENKIIDALSRSIHLLYETNVSTYESNLTQKVKTTLQNDEIYNKIRAELQKYEIGQKNQITSC